eukprot:4284-Heterococcus_DN1.PRE.3
MFSVAGARNLQRCERGPATVMMTTATCCVQDYLVQTCLTVSVCCLALQTLVMLVKTLYQGTSTVEQALAPAETVNTTSLPGRVRVAPLMQSDLAVSISARTFLYLACDTVIAGPYEGNCRTTTQSISALLTAIVVEQSRDTSANEAQMCVAAC